MAVYALEVIAAARDRLDDHGGHTGATPAGYYAYWQYDDAGCLWGNAELVRYLNQTLRDLGQRQPLLDDTRARYTVTLVAGTRQYAVPAEIVRIESVIRASDGEPLAKATVPEMQAVAKWHRHQRELLADDWRSSADNYPTHYLLDEKHGYLTVYPTPSADYLDTLYLVVRRTFLTEVDWTTLAHQSTTGAELLTSAGWTVGAGWAESPDDTFTHSSGTAALSHSATIIASTAYRLTLTVTGCTAGSCTIAVGGQTVTGITASSTLTLTATTTGAFTVTPTTDFNGVCTFSLLAVAALTALADIPDHAFDALVAGVCARAYLKRDADTHSPQLAAQCEAEFTRYAGPPRSFLNQEADARWADNPEAITPRTWLAR